MIEEELDAWRMFFRDAAEACTGAPSEETDPGSLDAICRREIQDVRETIREYAVQELGLDASECDGALGDVVRLVVEATLDEREKQNAIIGGRMQPPTDAEIARHRGQWLVSCDGMVKLFRGLEARERAEIARKGNFRWRWIAIGSDGCPTEVS